MPIDTFEQSEQDGEPIELYEFTAGVNVSRYTSWHRDYLYQAVTTFQTASIRRSAIEDSPELSRAPLDLTVARDFAICDLFRLAPPSYVVRLSVFRIHAGDSERALIWSGRVIDRTVEGSISATLHCEPVMTGIKRLGLTRKYQRACPHALYSEGPGRCNASRAAFSITANLSSVSGATVSSFTFALQPDGYYAGGDLEWDAGAGRIEYRGIRSHVGADLELTHPIIDLAALASVVVSAGCSHEISVCDSKFANSANYGGFVHIPQKNPYGGGSVF